MSAVSERLPDPILSRSRLNDCRIRLKLTQGDLTQVRSDVAAVDQQLANLPAADAVTPERAKLRALDAQATLGILTREQEDQRRSLRDLLAAPRQAKAALSYTRETLQSRAAGLEREIARLSGEIASLEAVRVKIDAEERSQIEARVAAGTATPVETQRLITLGGDPGGIARIPNPTR